MLIELLCFVGTLFLSVVLVFGLVWLWLLIDTCY